GRATQVYRGVLDNSNSSRDIDYVKVALFAGERIYIDVDGNTRAIAATVEYYDSTGTLVTSAVASDGSGNSVAPHAWFTAPQDGEFYIKLETSGTNTDTNYNLVLTIDDVKGALNEAGQFDYTVTENGV